MSGRGNLPRLSRLDPDRAAIWRGAKFEALPRRGHGAASLPVGLARALRPGIFLPAYCIGAVLAAGKLTSFRNG
ncbi:hypothetical protein GCM10011341_36320 [Frigidibacter albus]|nr:hypothetical protein GCM10011341_36320 [Frigidibacter albus]